MGKASGTSYRRVCASGNCNKLTRNIGLNRYGEKSYGVLCHSCHKYRMRNKKMQCEYPGCGFVAIHSVQIHIDHKDGNKGNNSPENLWCICANCHALKTQTNNEWINRYE
jgi:hypothetical protein